MLCAGVKYGLRSSVGGYRWPLLGNHPRNGGGVWDGPRLPRLSLSSALHTLLVIQRTHRRRVLIACLCPVTRRLRRPPRTQQDWLCSSLSLSSHQPITGDLPLIERFLMPLTVAGRHLESPTTRSSWTPDTPVQTAGATPTCSIAPMSGAATRHVISGANGA